MQWDEVHTLQKFAWLLVGFGMVWRVRADDMWDTTHLCCNMYMADLLTRTEYYDIASNPRAEVVYTLED